MKFAPVNPPKSPAELAIAKARMNALYRVQFTCGGETDVAKVFGSSFGNAARRFLSAMEGFQVEILSVSLP